MRITHSPSCAAAQRGSSLTLGNFDGVHLGHQALLARLSSHARAHHLETAVLTFSPQPRAFFTPDRAPAQLSSLREKIALLAKAGIERVHICRFNAHLAHLSPEDFIEDVIVRTMQARHVLVGDDFRFGAGRAGDVYVLQKAGAALGFSVEALPTQTFADARISSSAVRQALHHGNIALANQLLGRPYALSGRVQKGFQLGRTLGFPTLNIDLKGRRPALWGVYVVRVGGLAERSVLGVASIGTRPTVKAGLAPCVEVHLFDWQAMCYGARVNVEFLAYLRSEEKFDSLPALTQQIAADAQAARAWHAAHPIE